MARDHILSLRLGDDEYTRIAELAGDAPISDRVRGLLFDHLAEPARCGAVKPGNWNAGYLPICMLPSPHPCLKHWWHHEPSGDVITWSDDGTYSSYASGASGRMLSQGAGGDRD